MDARTSLALAVVTSGLGVVGYIVKKQYDDETRTCHVAGQLRERQSNRPLRAAQLQVVDSDGVLRMSRTTGTDGSFSWEGKCSDFEGFPIYLSTGPCRIWTGEYVSSGGAVNAYVDVVALANAGRGLCPR
jgi:hypothetical protein